MTSSYRKTVEKLNEQGAQDFDRLPCNWCQTPTLRSVLAQHGARCLVCYEAYCAAGLRGGVDGSENGAPDTADQRDMRKRLKDSRPVGQSMSASSDAADAKARDQAKLETDRKVAEYAKRNGLSLADSATLLAPRARVFEEPARFAEEDRA